MLLSPGKQRTAASIKNKLLPYRNARLFRPTIQELPGPVNAVNCEKFNHWLAGLIDGDGCFYLNRGKYPGCRITGHEDETDTLYLAQERFGGSITRDSSRNGVAARCFTWQLSGRAKMVALLNATNGKIITPKRYAQFVLLCAEVGIEPQPGVMACSSPWLAGFFDADGSVEIGRDTSLSLSIGQEDITVLEPLVKLWGGTIYYGTATRVSQWRLGSTGISLYLFAKYLATHSRSANKLQQLAVLQKVIAFRATTPIDRDAVHKLVDTFWIEKDSKR